MNFNNPFVSPFGYGQQYAPIQAPQMTQQVTRVNGENGARAYQMGPNSSALLLDENGLVLWLVMTDGAGYKTVTPYDIIPHKTQAESGISDLESRVRKLEETIGGITNGNAGHSSAVTAQPSKPNGGESKAVDGHGQGIREPSGHAEPAHYSEPAIPASNGYYPTARG